MPHLFIGNRSSQRQTIHYMMDGAGYQATIEPGTQQQVLTDAEKSAVDKIVDSHKAYGIAKAGDNNALALIHSDKTMDGLTVVDHKPSLRYNAPQTDEYDKVAADLLKG